MRYCRTAKQTPNIVDPDEQRSLYFMEFRAMLDASAKKSEALRNATRLNNANRA